MWATVIAKLKCGSDLRSCLRRCAWVVSEGDVRRYPAGKHCPVIFFDELVLDLTLPPWKPYAIIDRGWCKSLFESSSCSNQRAVRDDPAGSHFTSPRGQLIQLGASGALPGM